MINDDDKILLVAGSKKNPLVCELSTYNDLQLLDVRKYYTDKKTGALARTQKGVSLTRVQYEALAEAFRDKADKIESWFEEDTSLVSQNVKSLEASRHTKEELSIQITKWGGMEMSRYDQQGGQSSLYLNQNHPWIASLLDITDGEIGDKILGHVAILLQSHHKAQGFLDSRNINAMEVAETIESNWNLQSRIPLRTRILDA